MKITLTLEEAINYIKQHTDMGDYADAEIVIEGFDKPAEPKQEKEEPEAVEEKPAPKKRRRRKAAPKEEENVTQEQIDAIASEVDKELKEEFKEELNATVPEPTTITTSESTTDSETTRTEVQPDLFDGLKEEVKDEIVSTESAEESGTQQLEMEPEVAQDVLDEGINVPVSEEPSLFDEPVKAPSLFPEDEATESFEDTEMSMIDEVLAETGDDEAFEPEPTMDIFDQSIPYEEREAFAKANGLVPPLF